MGQQQLLLMILVMILVGIAMVVAINTFEESRTTANHDAIRQEMTDAASLAQAYYNKPEIMGGGGNSYNNISLSELQISTNGELGRFSLSNIQSESFQIVAVPAAGEINIIGTVSLNGISFEEEARDEDE